MLGTEAEKALLEPAVPFYGELAKALVEKQISVDLFLGAAQYTDVATLGALTQTSGGQLFFYPSFQAGGPSAEALYGDVFHVLTRETGFEAVYRVRVPQGAKISVFHGNFCLSNTDLMVVPVCHSDMTVGAGVLAGERAQHALLPHPGRAAVHHGGRRAPHPRAHDESADQQRAEPPLRARQSGRGGGGRAAAGWVW